MMTFLVNTAKTRPPFPLEGCLRTFDESDSSFIRMGGAQGDLGRVCLPISR
jgi:hypothetical protein